MKQLVEKSKKPLWFVKKPEVKIVIKISDIKNHRNGKENEKRQRRLKNEKSYV